MAGRRVVAGAIVAILTVTAAPALGSPGHSKRKAGRCARTARPADCRKAAQRAHHRAAKHYKSVVRVPPPGPGQAGAPLAPSPSAEPPAEAPEFALIPRAASVMTIAGAVGGRRRVSATHTFTDPRDVDSMVATIEGLSRVPAGETFECPEEPVGSPTVEILFRASRKGKPVATVSATLSGCMQTYVRLTGQNEVVVLSGTAAVIYLGESLLSAAL